MISSRNVENHLLRVTCFTEKVKELFMVDIESKWIAEFQENQMSIDQSEILRQRVGMSQNFINTQRNSSVLSNRVS